MLQPMIPLKQNLVEETLSFQYLTNSKCFNKSNNFTCQYYFIIAINDTFSLCKIQKICINGEVMTRESDDEKVREGGKKGIR